MTLAARLLITNLKTHKNPLITVRVLGLKDQAGLKRLVAIAGEDAISLGLRPFAAARRNTNTNTPIRSKTQTQQVMPATSALLQLQVYAPVRKVVTLKTLQFMCAPQEEIGEVRMRLCGELITLLSGPLRRVHALEAAELMGALYNPKQEYDGAIHGPFYGVQVSGTTRTTAPKLVTTVDQSGNETQTHIRRRSRRVG